MSPPTSFGRSNKDAADGAKAWSEGIKALEAKRRALNVESEYKAPSDVTRTDLERIFKTLENVRENALRTGTMLRAAIKIGVRALKWRNERSRGMRTCPLHAMRSRERSSANVSTGPQLQKCPFWQ